MPTEKKYKQCELHVSTPTSVSVTMAWIEERGAKEGAQVELKNQPFEEFVNGKRIKDPLWTVSKVAHDVVLAESQLREMQIQHHGSLPSVEAMGR